LCNFTKNAGKQAQRAAEERCQVCSNKAQDSYFTRRPSIFPIFDSARLPQFFSWQINLYNRNCKLETDELLKWFQSIGTPEFIEKGNSARPSSNENMQSGNKDKKPLQHITDSPKKGSENLSQKDIHATAKKMTILKEAMKDTKNLTTSSSFNGVVSSQLGFSQYANLCKPFNSDV
jgi:hypothetical protein